MMLDSVSVFNKGTKYVALIECEPVVKLLMLKTAVPLFNETDPIKVDPSYKFTDPSTGSGLMVAVKTTFVLEQEVDRLCVKDNWAFTLVKPKTKKNKRK
jgi:hypothetical protein